MKYITTLIAATNSHTSLLTPTATDAAATVTPKTSNLSLILSSHIKNRPTLQSSYSFVSTDVGPDATIAPLSSGPLLAGVLSVVGILCIAAMIIVIVLIVVIRGRRKTTRTLDNGRFVILLCACTTSCLKINLCGTL